MVAKASDKTAHRSHLFDWDGQCIWRLFRMCSTIHSFIRHGISERRPHTA